MTTEKAETESWWQWSVDAARQRIRQDSWAGVLEKTDRVLSSRPVTVSLVYADPSQPAGWSNGETITINMERIDLENVISAKGVNFHELCHVLFTPRQSDAICKRLTTLYESGESRIFTAFNLLEDPRIENLFVGTYRPAARYFESMMYDYVLAKADPEPSYMEHLLAHGRLYLPAEFRARIKSETPLNPDTVVQAEAVIDEYLVIDPMTEVERALGLIKTMASILETSDIAQAERRGDIGFESSSGTVVHGDVNPEQAGSMPAFGTPRRSDFVKAQAMVKEDLEAARAEDAKTEVPDSGDSAREDAEKRQEGIESDRQMQAEVQQTKDAVKAASRMPGTGRGIDAPVVGTIPIPEDYRRAARKIANRLRRLRTEAEPETLHRQHVGRLDMRRVIRRQPGELDIFKVWDEGTEDELGVEVAVLVDRSSSMSKFAREATFALWTLKRGFDLARGVRTTVLGFDTSAYMIYRPNERAGNEAGLLRMSGGTEPLLAVEAADNLFSTSRMKHKALIVLTDGEWGQSDPRTAIIARFRRMGVQTMLLNLKRHSTKDWGFETIQTVASLDGLVKAVADMTYRIQRDAFLGSH